MSLYNKDKQELVDMITSLWAQNRKLQSKINQNFQVGFTLGLLFMFIVSMIISAVV